MFFIALASWLLLYPSISSSLYTRSSRLTSWQASTASCSNSRAICRAVSSFSFSFIFSHTCLPFHTAGVHMRRLILKICGTRLFRLDHCHSIKPL